jgi:hypothetical protein
MLLRRTTTLPAADAAADHQETTMSVRAPRFHRTRAGAAALLAVLLLAAGCSSGGGDAGGSASDLAPATSDKAVESLQSDTGRSADSDSGGDATGANRPAVSTRAVISQGTIDLVTPDLEKVRGQVEDLLARYDGYLGEERSSNRPGGEPDRTTLKLRFPAAHFDTVMDRLEDLADKRGSTRSSEDVTTKVIDVATRVESARATITQLEKFLAAATDVRDMVSVESEISRRQADLESLLAQQKYLDDATSLATVTVVLWTPKTYVAPPSALKDAGFLTGLRAGWGALVDVLIVAATAIGAVLPFMLVALLLGLPALFVLRSVMRRRTVQRADAE